MNSPGSSVLPPIEAKQELVQCGSERAVFILDGGGRIISCGKCGGNLVDPKINTEELIGRPISRLIPFLSVGGHSPSYHARCLAHWCTEGVWRVSEAVSFVGTVFPVEINLTQISTDGREVFLLKIRWPDFPASS